MDPVLLALLTQLVGGGFKAAGAGKNARAAAREAELQRFFNEKKQALDEGRFRTESQFSLLGLGEKQRQFDLSLGQSQFQLGTQIQAQRPQLNRSAIAQGQNLLSTVTERERSRI